jgi:hypothetical protein
MTSANYPNDLTKDNTNLPNTIYNKAFPNDQCNHFDGPWNSITIQKHQKKKSNDLFKNLQLLLDYLSNRPKCPINISILLNLLFFCCYHYTNNNNETIKNNEKKY